MNYQSLKGMIDSLVKSYKCPQCKSLVTDTDIDIIGAAGTTINIDIGCSDCGKHSMIKTEVLSIDLAGKKMTPENIQMFKEKLLNKKGSIISGQKINDSEIVSLNKDLRKTKLNVSDLFGEDK